MHNPQKSQQQLRQPFLNRNKEDQPPFPQLFAILNDKADQQILQVALAPASIAFIKAIKIYSSAQIKTAKAANQRIPIFSMMRRQVEVEHIVNDSPALKILGIKHPIKSGPILILDLAVYRESFYFNFDYLIASLKNPIQRVKHPQMSLQLAEYKDNILDSLDISQDILVLQAQSLIIEKYLAEEEQFNLYQKEGMIAISKSVKVESCNGRSLKIKGPGWVFFQTNCLEMLNQRKNRLGLKILVYVSILMAIMQILLANLL